MKKVLLISLPGTDYGKIKSKDIYTSPPIGISYIASYLKMRGVQVELLDLVFYDDYFKIIKEKLVFNEYLIVGISSTTAQIKNAYKLINLVKSINKKTYIVLGGIHATSLPKKTLEESKADFIVTCEGELVFYNLVESLSEGFCLTSLKKIKGLVFRYKNRIFQNTKGNFIENLDKLPYPAYDLLPLEKYKNFMMGVSVGVTSSRGCPYDCSFCSIHMVHGKKIRVRSSDNFVDELEYWNRRFNIKNFIFNDDIFTFDKKRVIEICSKIIKKKIKIKWFCSTRVDSIDDEILGFMKKAGCSLIGIGIETIDQELLDKCNKKLNMNKVNQGIRLIKKHGIDIWGYFIFGFPGDNLNTLKNSVNFALKKRLEYANFAYLIPYPKTKLWDELNFDKKKKIDWDCFKKYDGSLIKFENMNKKKVMQHFKKISLKFYLHPRFILNRISHLLKSDTDSFELLKIYIKSLFVLLRN